MERYSIMNTSVNLLKVDDKHVQDIIEVIVDETSGKKKFCINVDGLAEDKIRGILNEVLEKYKISQHD